MATKNHTPLSSAIRLCDDVSDSLKKAQAIIWLLANQANEITNEEAVSYAAIAANEYVDRALAAVDLNMEQARAQ
jgi:hypothetical protein